MKLHSTDLRFLLCAALFWCTYATATPVDIEEDIKSLVSNLEAKKESVLQRKYGALRETKMKRIEFNERSIIEALEQISDRVTKETGEVINYHFSDDIKRSLSKVTEHSYKVDLKLSNVSADEAIRFIVSNIMVNGYAGLECLILRNDVYFHHVLEAPDLPEMNELDEKLRQLDKTLHELRRQLESLQVEAASDRTLETSEKLILKDVAFRSKELSYVLKILQQSIDEKLDENTSVYLVPNSTTFPEVTYEAESVSLRQAAEDITKDVGWHLEYRQNAILFSPKPKYERYEKERERIRKIEDEPLAPHVSIEKKNRDNSGLTLQVDYTKADAESNTVRCKLINDTRIPYYFVSTSMLVPDYLIAKVDEDGERVEKLFHTCAMGPMRYTPELPPGTLTQFNANIGSTGERFQIGVRIGLKRHGVTHASKSQGKRLKHHSLGIIWSEVIERPQPDNENKSLLEAASGQRH